MLVKTLIKELQKENPLAVVFIRAYEEGSAIKEIISKEHCSDMYWKGDAPIQDKTIPTVMIGCRGDYGIDINKTQYEKLIN